MLIDRLFKRNKPNVIRKENLINHLTADLMHMSLDDGQIAEVTMTQSKVCIKACNNSDVNTISSKVILSLQRDEKGLIL